MDKPREMLEAMTLGRLVRTLTDQGYTVEAMQTHEVAIWVYCYRGVDKPEDDNLISWVKLIPGKGEDMIDANSPDLTEIMRKIGNDLRESEIDRFVRDWNQARLATA